MLAGTPDLTVPMPVLACTGASIENNFVCIHLTVPIPVLACTGASIENNIVCICACIALYLGLYWSVLDCIGIVLVNKLASALVQIEKIGMYLVCFCKYHYFIHTKYQGNTCQ